jgi:hypothetical protein
VVSNYDSDIVWQALSTEKKIQIQGGVQSSSSNNPIELDKDENEDNQSYQNHISEIIRSSQNDDRDKQNSRSKTVIPKTNDNKNKEKFKSRRDEREPSEDISFDDNEEQQRSSIAVKARIEKDATQSQQSEEKPINESQPNKNNINLKINNLLI